MLFSRLAQSAAALALLTIGFAAPVQAQQNKQIISGTWYEDRATATVSTSMLTLTFTQTPTNQFLNVTNVACNIFTTTSQGIIDVNLQAGTTSGGSDLGRPYPVRGTAIPEIIGTTKSYSIVANLIYFKFGPGRFPSIEIDTATTGSLSVSASCVIVGNLTDS